MPLDDVAHRLLMRRVAIAVQEHDDRDLGAGRDQFLGRRDGIRLGQRIELAAIRSDAAADLAHQRAWDQRQRTPRVEPHRMRDRETLQLEEVAEAARHDHAGARALALDQRVCRDRAAMRVRHVTPRGRVEAERGSDLVDPFKNARARPRRRARHLEAMHLAATGVKHQIGEGAADIGAEIAGRSR